MDKGGARPAPVIKTTPLSDARVNQVARITSAVGIPPPVTSTVRSVLQDRPSTPLTAWGGVRSGAMELDEALYTTRAMRRVRPDPIPHDVQARILDAAIRAPSGGNKQNCRFLLPAAPASTPALAPLYQHARGELWKSIYKDQIEAAHANPDAPESVQVLKVQR